LDVTGAPEVTFALADETPVAVYAYCNLHGLWKAEI
jgi:superoxide reductase